MRKIFFLIFFLFHISVIVITNIGTLCQFDKEIVFSQLPNHSKKIIKGISFLKPDAKALFMKVVRTYATITGTNTGYGFFSPNVPSNKIVFFDLTNRETGEKTIQTPYFKSNDGLERFKVNVGLFQDIEKIRPLLAQCWATRMLEFYPETSNIDVGIGLLLLPSMEQYRSGERLSLIEQKRYSFELNTSHNP